VNSLIQHVPSVNALLPFLDPENLINSFGPYALLGICLIIFAETGLLIGFLFPGDTLLIITGVFAYTNPEGFNIWWSALAIGFAAFLGGEVGYLIGHKVGPRIFERKESGFFSRANVDRTNAFFERFGPWAVVLARFVPIVRTFAPIAAGVGHMSYRRYSLYNLVGAILWGVGVTFLGYWIAHIPPVRHFVESYIDVILVGAVLIALVPTLFHLFQGSRKAKKANAIAAAEAVQSADVSDSTPTK
jgi:membrane-associated protein